MRIGAHARGLIVVAALAAFGTSQVACKKDSPKESASADKGDKKSDKKGDKKGDDDGDDAPAYTKGDVLKHMPGKCKTAFFYMDLAGLQKTDAFKDNADKLQDKLAESIKGEDGEKAEKVLKAFKKSGINPTKDVQELAICVGEDTEKDVVIGFGGAFAGKDPIGAITKAMEAGGEDAPKKKTDGGVTYIVEKDKKSPAVIAEVAPGVVLLTQGDDVAPLKKLKKVGEIADGYNFGKGRLASMHGQSPDGKGFAEADLAITSKGSDIEIKVAATGVDKHALTEVSDAKIKEGKKELATMVKSSPFKMLADDIDTLKVKADGDKVSVSITIAGEHLAAAIKKITDMKEEELEALGGKM
ncbi:MAG: hypothetical protein ACHREM_16610 [Polyangiales bacterium]